MVTPIFCMKTAKVPPGLGSRHLSLTDSEASQLHLGGNSYTSEIDPNFLAATMTSTPPDINIPMTPILQNMNGLDDFVAMNGGLDQDGDNQFLSMEIPNGPMDFDMSNVLDFMTPPTIVQGLNDSFSAAMKGFTPPLKTNGPARPPSDFATVSSKRTASPSPANNNGVSLQLSAHHMSLHEPDAVSGGLDYWPMFRCNPTPRNVSPPKTAKIYLEGLAQNLRSPDTWNNWTPELDVTDHNLDSKISSEPIVGWSREKLIAITQGFLYKALDIHKAAPQSREGSPGSPDSHGMGFLMLPPPHVIQNLLRSYVIRHELYYPCNPAGSIDPNDLMQLSNSKASSLLVLLMVAQGAAATPSIEARYLTSGLTEACRISLFDIIEKDIYLAADPLVLRSALLFMTLAAWSGDKWHMDIAIGQRGMYLAELVSYDRILKVIGQNGRSKRVGVDLLTRGSLLTKK
ncbi:putative transcription factor cmr1 [Phaeomoniella chlamydospora]|uniref:Putative transcription factor cmr1 n=1 Tax=Phaeomoniella chlamydospora TaxID=158046 RepID=A0A0G2H627_PHACM|nr:putative transcription factor cmr1 [Phaeomoniella chlamydospora]